MARTIGVILAMRDQFTGPAKKIVSNTRNVNREIRRTQTQIRRFAQSVSSEFKKIARNTAVVGVGAITVFAKKSVDLAKDQIEVETKLSSVMRNTKGVTEAQIESIKKYAGELQNIGVIGDEVAIAGVQQLATYQLQSDTLKMLMPGMEDLIAQQKGLNASQDDAVNIGNMIGKVMAGQVGALSRAGINFSKAQGEILKYGTEQEKAAVLAEVLEQNVGGVNKAMAQTDQGRMQQAANAFGDMQEEVGKRLLPVLGEFSKWFINKIPSIQNSIMETIESFKEFKTTVNPYLDTVKSTMWDIYQNSKEVYDFIKNNFGTIAPIIMTIVGAMAAYKLAVTTQMLYTKALAFAEFVKNGVLATGATVVNANTIAQWAWNAAMKANPIGMIIAGITALIVVGILLYKNWDKIKAKALVVFDFIKSVVKDVAKDLKKSFKMAIEGIQMILMFLWDIIKAIFEDIKLIARSVGADLKRSFKMAIEGIQLILMFLWDVIKGIFEDIKLLVINVAVGIKRGFEGAIEGIKSMMTLLFEIVGLELSKTVEYMKTQFDNVLSFIKNVLTGNFKEAGKNLVDMFLEPFKSIYETVKGIIGKVKGAFGDSVEVNVKETVTEKTVKGTRKAARFATGMREYAKGGIATRASIFGEAGLEIAIPLKKNNQRSMSLLDYANKFFSSNKAGHDSDGTNDIRNITSNRSDKTTVRKVDSKTSNKTENNFNFYGDVYGMDDFKEKVAEVIVRIHKKDKPNTPVVV